MRICLFTPTFLPAVGGAEKDADMIARGLIQRGHEVTVLAPRFSGSMPSVPYRVERYARPWRQHLWPEVLGLKLRRAHRRHRFDTVLAFYAYPTGYVAARLKHKLGFGAVLSPRGADLSPHFHGLRKRRVPQCIRDGYANADSIVSISQYLTKRLHDVVGIDRLPPTELVCNGLDLEAFDAELDTARGVPPLVEGRYVLHLARVAPVKRQDLAVLGVAEARAAFEEHGVKYAIVGDGSGMAALRKQVSDLGLESIVKILGTRSGLEKAWLYRNAEFFVSTSREEAFGNVVIEAMAAGLPMLASDIGSHLELIGEQGWGQLFEYDNAADLGQHLTRWLATDLTAMRERAAELRGRYSLSKMIDGYENACRQAAELR